MVVAFSPHRSKLDVSPSPHSSPTKFYAPNTPTRQSPLAVDLSPHHLRVQHHTPHHRPNPLFSIAISPSPRSKLEAAWRKMSPARNPLKLSSIKSPLGASTRSGMNTTSYSPARHQSPAKTALYFASPVKRDSYLQTPAKENWLGESGSYGPTPGLRPSPGISQGLSDMASPLKRSDGCMHLDRLEMFTEPNPKRRSLHGAPAGFVIPTDLCFGSDGTTDQDDETDESTRKSIEYSEDGPILQTSLPAPALSFAPRRQSSLKKVMTPGTTDASETAKETGRPALFGSATRKSRLSTPAERTIKRMPSMDNFLAPHARANLVSFTSRDKATDDQHDISAISAPTISESVFSNQKSSPQRKSVNFSTESPVTYEVDAMSKSSSSTQNSQASSFETPQNFKHAKPMALAFMSTGLISKKIRHNQIANQAPPSPNAGNDSFFAPDTPCKKNPDFAASWAGPPPRDNFNVMPRGVRDVFANDSFSPVPNRAFGGPKRPLRKSLLRRSGFASLDEGVSSQESQEDSSTQNSTDFDIPPTPTKKHGEYASDLSFSPAPKSAHSKRAKDTNSESLCKRARPSRLRNVVSAHSSESLSFDADCNLSSDKTTLFTPSKSLKQRRGLFNSQLRNRLRLPSSSLTQKDVATSLTPLSLTKYPRGLCLEHDEDCEQKEDSFDICADVDSSSSPSADEGQLIVSPVATKSRKGLLAVETGTAAIAQIATPNRQPSPGTPQQESLVPPDPSGLSISGKILPKSPIDSTESPEHRRYRTSYPPATPTSSTRINLMGNGEMRRDSFGRPSSIALTTPISKPSGGGDYFDGLKHYDASLATRFGNFEAIGSGVWSEVYQVSKPISPSSVVPASNKNQTFAVKRSKGRGRVGFARRDVFAEVRVLKALGSDCDYVIRYYDNWEDRGRLYIQTEFCDNGNLHDFLSDYSDRRLDEFRVWKMLLEMSLGLQHIHDCGIVHLDIKPANVLISFDGVLKIADFGMAEFIPVDTNADLEGDRIYLAPELLQRHEYDKPADVYSLGISMLEIAANVVLPDNGTVWQQLRSGDMSEVPTLSNTSSTLASSANTTELSFSDSSNDEPLVDISPAESIWFSNDKRLARKYTKKLKFRDAPLPKPRELQMPPRFMTDKSLDHLIFRMMAATPTERPTITQVLHDTNVMWVDSRRAAGAIIYEGDFGPSDYKVAVRHDSIVAISSGSETDAEGDSQMSMF